MSYIIPGCPPGDPVRRQDRVPLRTTALVAQGVGRNIAAGLRHRAHNPTRPLHAILAS
jgi:hypothetical protein